MKTLLTLTMVVLLAGSAFAQLDNSMGLFFGTDLLEADTNIDPAVSTPFDAYVALLNPTLGFIGGYEVGITLNDPSLLVIAVAGPNGWTNFGDNLNHLCGYGTPVMTGGVSTILSTLTMMHLAPAPSDVFMGPSVPSSVEGAGPAVADGTDPNVLIICTYSSGPDFGGLVATFMGEGIEFPPGVATENASWSGVKALFN